MTDALTRRFIYELREFWKYHPKHRDMVDSIQGKYSFKERPQKGILVKASGGSHVALSADNYKGMVLSYVFLTKVNNKPGVALEWVHEDGRAIQENGGFFPSTPGVYYIDIVKEADKVQFYVDPLLDVYHEQPLQTDANTLQLQNTPVAGSIRLFEMPSGFLYQEGVNYSVSLDAQGNPTGEINLTQPLSGGLYLQADYRYEGESLGPYPIYEMHANNQAIPGCILAFGRRVEVGDQMAVVVQDIRRPAALEYGGRWTLSFDFDVFARDVYDQREIQDSSVMLFQGLRRGVLSSEGIEVNSVSMGGESEEVYDETGDDYYYNSSFSMEVETEWSIHVPLVTWLRQVSPLTNAHAKEVAGYTEDQLIGEDGDIQGLASLNLQSVQDPFWSGRSGTFEMIR